jgi:pyruvate dehydrogenase E1 component
MGELDRSYLFRLRERGGLQSYPSRTKDPDVADFSTGSVGLGVVAPLFAAMTRRDIDHHFTPSPKSRFISSSATPNSTKATSGRPSPTPPCKDWET